MDYQRNYELREQLEPIFERAWHGPASMPCEYRDLQALVTALSILLEESDASIGSSRANGVATKAFSVACGGCGNAASRDQAIQMALMGGASCPRCGASEAVLTLDLEPGLRAMGLSHLASSRPGAPTAKAPATKPAWPPTDRTTHEVELSLLTGETAVTRVSSYSRFPALLFHEGEAGWTIAHADEREDMIGGLESLEQALDLAELWRERGVDYGKVGWQSDRDMQLRAKDAWEDVRERGVRPAIVRAPAPAAPAGSNALGWVLVFAAALLLALAWYAWPS